MYYLLIFYRIYFIYNLYCYFVYHVLENQIWIEIEIEINIEIEIENWKVSGFIRITVKLTVLPCLSICRKILAAILLTNSCKFNSECIKHRNLLYTLINTRMYCEINSKISNLTVISCTRESCKIAWYFVQWILTDYLSRYSASLWRLGLVNIKSKCNSIEAAKLVENPLVTLTLMKLFLAAGAASSDI